jgi:hypothetical protein
MGAKHGDLSVATPEMEAKQAQHPPPPLCRRRPSPPLWIGVSLDSVLQDMHSKTAFQSA